MERIRICIKQSDPDPYQIEKNYPDPDRYQSEKQDPDPYPKRLDPQHWVKLGKLKAILGQYGLG
jgi:hypothetical protein